MSTLEVTADHPGAHGLDFLVLTKPRITLLVVSTTAVGLCLAPIAVALSTAVWTLLGTALIVAGANTLNMFLERDVDAKMTRTRNRPLPAGRLLPSAALGFGLTLSAIGLFVLFVLVRPTAGAAGLVALVVYVLMYTPLKRRSWAALLVGAVAGAMPPAIGWTAATGGFERGALLLFGVMFFWQLPHFVAISLFRADDYGRAGLHTLAGDWGVGAAKVSVLGYTAALVGVTLLGPAVGIGGALYVAVAATLGAAMVGLALWGLRPRAGTRWSHALFVATLVYLTVLLGALCADPRLA